jgi:CubicO group peptidase (beta-lactamase class C family)
MTLRMKLAVAVAAAVLAFNASADDVTTRVDEVFKDWSRSDAPGCALAVTQDGNIVFERGYGMADLEQGVAIRPDTVFNIASLSKQFTAVALLLLQEQGKLSLDDDVRKYVGELPDYGKRITLRHLANHTSGLRDLPELLGLAGWNWVDDVPAPHALELIGRQRQLNFAPGEEYAYSNSGYFLMALIIERVSGQSFGQFTRENIFTPLGMLHSRFYDDRRMIMKNRALGHVKLPGGGFGAWRPTYQVVGDGGLLTTVEDLARWERNFLQPRLGRDPGKLVADMLEPGVLNDGKKIDYGLGLMMGDYRGLPMIHHGGSVPGYNTIMLRLPQQKFAAIVLCNVGGGPARVAAKAVADIYLDGQFPRSPEAPTTRTPTDPPPKAQRPPSATELKKLAGAYYSAELNARYTLKVEGGQLIAVVGHQPSLPLYAVDSRRFHNSEYDLTLSFGGRGFELQTGEISGMKFERTTSALTH